MFHEATNFGSLGKVGAPVPGVQGPFTADGGGSSMHRNENWGAEKRLRVGGYGGFKEGTDNWSYQKKVKSTTASRGEKSKLGGYDKKISLGTNSLVCLVGGGAGEGVGISWNTV